MSEGLTAKVLTIVDLVSYQDGSVDSRVLLKQKGENVSLLGFDAGQELSEHTAPFDALVNVLGDAAHEMAGFEIEHGLKHAIKRSEAMTGTKQSRQAAKLFKGGYGAIALLGATLLMGEVGRSGELAGQKLLITSIRTGDTEVFVVDPELGDAQNLSRSPKSEDRYPCWSPDGKHVAFTSNRDGPYSLYVMDADGNHVKRLVNNQAVCYMPSWQRTAQGERIVFGMHGEKPEMASISPDGSDLKVLGVGHDPTLSPDGKSICYTGEVQGGVAVFVMDVDGANKRRIVPETSKVGATFPNWSPDSRQIVYSYPVDDALELFIIKADGTAKRQLTKLGKVCTPAAWSPDGKWISFRYTDERYWSNKQRMDIVYAEKRADKRPVWIIRPDGSDAQVVESLHYQMSIDGSRASWKPAPTADSAR